MDNKELDFGLDEEAVENTEETKEKVVSLEEKKARKPWFDWDVGGRTYKLILSTTNIMKVEEQYLREGGSQTDLLSDVIIPVMSVSGFFTETQAAVMESKMDGMDALI